MTRPSPLRLFDYNAIEDLLEDGIAMTYVPYLDRINLWGQWDPQKALVRINPQLSRQEGSAMEDVIILHEWLHAYGDLILEVPDTRFRENQIEWWARYHYAQDSYLATYIRSFFQREGFWTPESEKVKFRIVGSRMKEAA